MTRLAIFDIDGTLTRTNAVDDECYCLAVAEALGVRATDVSWAGAPHVTDSGILDWLWRRHRRLAPSDEQLAAVRRRFCQLLAEAHVAAPSRFAPLPGAVGILPRIEAKGWHVAFATGGWRQSAEFKLRSAGIVQGSRPLAAADDAMTRAEIIECARAAAEHRAGDAFARVVSVGDGVWDVATALDRRLPFVGIGVGEGADLLYAAGADVVLAEFTDPQLLLDALDRASVPPVSTRNVNARGTAAPTPEPPAA